MIEKYFKINNPNSEYAKKVINNNLNIDNYLSSGKSIEHIPEFLKKESVNLAVLLQGKDEDSKKCCNFNCDICYTKEHFNKIGLSGNKLINAVNETKKLGAIGLYVPGIGEPTKSKAFWKYLEYESKNNKFPTIMFTNGSYIYDKKLQQEIGLNKNQMLERIKTNNLYQYVKFWTTNPKKSKKMYGIDTPYVNHKGINIPYCLDVLLNKISKEKIGIEVVARKDNIGEIFNKIIPFCEKEEIKCFIEPVIPVKWGSDLKLTKVQEDKLEDVLAICGNGNYCKNRVARDIIINIDTFAPCIVFPRLEKYKITNTKNNIKNYKELFKMLHDKNYRDMRKITSEGCNCNRVLSGELKWE